MKKILIPTFFSNYGGSIFVLLKSAEILRKKHKVIIKAPLKEADISNISIPATINKKDQIKLSIKFFKHFIKELIWIKKENFDILYIHDYPALYIYGLIAKILNIKVVWHVHDGDIKKLKRTLNFILSNKRIYIAKFQIPDFDKNYCWIPNYIEDFNLNKTIKKHKNNIVIAGSICNRKNQKFGIEMIKHTKDKKLFLYGSVIDEKYFNELDIDNKIIFYKGFKRKMEILKFADIIFMPSKEEAQGLILIEALGNKVPVLAPDIEAVKEISKIIGYENYLYKKNNINDCISKLQLLENLKKEELEKFQKKVLEICSLKVFEKKILNCFDNIVFNN